jgi:Tfp pilus assembly protein FimT
MMCSRRAATLVELLVTLVILAAMASVTTLAIRRIDKPTVADPAETIVDSLRIAVAEARTITLAMRMHGAAAMATVYPDGSVIADTAFHIDPLTGRRTDAR